MSIVATEVPEQIMTVPARTRRVPASLWRAGFVLLTLVYVGVVFNIGLDLRNWLWTNSKELRFHADIQNAMRWGGTIVQEAQSFSHKQGKPITWWEFSRAYYRAYDRVVEQTARGGRFALDYPPLRLLIMSAWMKSISDTEPNLPGYRDELVEPLLKLNTTFEAISCVGIFLLVRRWKITCASTADGSASAGIEVAPVLAGLVAATLYWFNPAILVNAHIWPQWDTWVVPFYVWAVYFGISRKWVLAGVVIALGALLKGQLLIVAPVLFLWPLFAGRFISVGKFVLGFVLTIGVITLPWLVEWNFNWFHVGIAYGTRAHPNMHAGDTYNLAAIMNDRYGWRIRDTVDVPGALAPNGKVELGIFLRSIYCVSLVLCAIGAAIHDRRKNLHLLVALSAPWLMMYAINAQMHERYMVYIAGISAVLACLGVGWALLHVLISIIATLPMMHVRVPINPQTWRWWENLLRGLDPGLGWAVLLIAGIFLYYTFVPKMELSTTKPRSHEPEPSSS